MNVLIFVTTVLMLLALITYARLETYRGSQIFHLLFEHYMQKDERGYTNMVAEKVYDSTKGSTKQSKNSGQKVAASPRVVLGVLLRKTEREQAPQEVTSVTALLKNLMMTLYADQPFYHQIAMQRPSFLDEIVAGLEHAVDQLSDEHKPKKAVDLANISLGDDQLDDVFYKMLHGAAYKEVNHLQEVHHLIEGTKEEVESDEDASDANTIEKEAEEHHSPKGYYSLLDFVTLQPLHKVRIYLASKEVLKAIYRDDALVEDLIRKRNELYHEAQLADEEGVKSMSESFQNEFQNRHDPAVHDDILDYTITKTNPKKYE